MPLGTIKGALLRPGDYIQAQLKDRANRQDRLPGTRFLAWYQVAMSVLMAVLAWSSLGVLLALFKGVGWRPAWLWGLSQALWAQSLSPVAMAVHLGEDLALSFISAWLLAELLDQAFRRLYGHAGGQQVLVFNAVLRTTLPWALFMVIPVLGWIVVAVGTLWITVKVLGQVYAEKDLVRVVVAGAVALIPAAVVTLVLGMSMHLVSGSLLEHDPLQPLVDRVLALGERPRWNALALERVTAAAPGPAAEPAPPSAPALAAAAPAAAELQPVAAAPVPARTRSAAPARQQAAPAQAPAPAPSTAAAPESPQAGPSQAAQAPAGDAMGAGAPANTAVPTPAPTPGQGVGVAVGKAVGREALRQGAADTVRLLRLFH